MTIGKVELEGTLAKYYSVYDTNGEHLFNTDCFYEIELYGYTDSTITIIDGNNIIVYGEDGEIIKCTEDTRLESCLASNKTPVFCLDKSFLKTSFNAIKTVNNSKNYDTSHTQQTMREAKQRDSEKRAKGIAKQKEIFKARMIKAIGVVLTVVFYLIFVL